MTIGLLSDTHGYLDPTIIEHFKDCDEIWHAGDIGDAEVVDELEKHKPLQAVFGNIDDPVLRARFKEDIHLMRGGLSIWMTHIGGRPPHFNTRINKLLKENKSQVFICGHSHVLLVKRDEKSNLLCINPGAAGHHGFHSMRTIIRMEIKDAKVVKMEVIELGKRGVNSVMS